MESGGDDADADADVDVLFGEMRRRFCITRGESMLLLLCGGTFSSPGYARIGDIPLTRDRARDVAGVDVDGDMSDGDRVLRFFCLYADSSARMRSSCASWTAARAVVRCARASVSVGF